MNFESLFVKKLHARDTLSYIIVIYKESFRLY